MAAEGRGLTRVAEISGAIEIREPERITQQSTSVVNVLLPDRARVPRPCSGHGTSKALERTRNVLAGRHINKLKSSVCDASN